MQESVQVLATTRTNVIAAHDAMNAFLVRCDIWAMRLLIWTRISAFFIFPFCHISLVFWTRAFLIDIKRFNHTFASYLPLISYRQRMRRMPTLLALKSSPPRSSSCSAPNSSSPLDEPNIVAQTNPNDSKHLRYWLFSFCPCIHSISLAVARALAFYWYSRILNARLSCGLLPRTWQCNCTAALASAATRKPQVQHTRLRPASDMETAHQQAERLEHATFFTKARITQRRLHIHDLFTQ